MCDKSAGKFFWKGKRVTEKVYNLRVRQANAGKMIRSVYGCKQTRTAEQSVEKSNLKDGETKSKIEGRRIVHIQTLVKEMVCSKCNSILSFRDILDEKLIGLACMWTVQCQDCLCTTRIATDQLHKCKTKTKQGKEMFRYGVNTAGAMGNYNVHVAKKLVYILISTVINNE